MRTPRLDSVQRLLLVCALTASPGVAIARQPEAVLPANVDVDPRLRMVIEGMRQRSPAFRRQISRIGSVRTFRVGVLPEDRTRPGPEVDARTVFTFDRGVLAAAHIYLRIAKPELIAHEMEHIVEQLDGIDLQVQAGNGVVWKGHDASFETSRAIKAGQLVAQEVARGPDDSGEAPLEAAGGGVFAAVVQREPDASPLSERTGRLSASGRFVAFISAARLVERDRNGRRDVYVFDRESGRLSLESVGPLEQPADGESRAADISADGRFLAFASEAGDLTDSPFAPGTSQVFLRDRVLETTRLLTANASGEPANGSSRNPVIAAAGTTVVFESAATDFPGSGSGIFFVRIRSGPVTQVDVAADSGLRRGASMSPAISADGRYVVFASRADLTCIERRGCPADNGVADIYLRDIVAGVTRRISRSISGGEPNGASYHPAISGNGRFVAFVSEASNLTHDPVRRGAQIYIHDLLGGTTELITRTRAGRPANGNSLRPAMSHEGLRIAYQSLASDLLCGEKCKAGQADINLQWDVYVHDRQSRETIRVSRGSGVDWMDYSRAPSLDASGSVVVFVTRHPVDGHDHGYDEDLLIQQLSTSISSWPNRVIGERWSMSGVASRPSGTKSPASRWRSGVRRRGLRRRPGSRRTGCWSSACRHVRSSRPRSRVGRG